jgi:hypothetical protein
MNNNLKEISNFIKKNNSYSDFNLVNNFLLNLNFTKINFNKNLSGGNFFDTNGNTNSNTNDNINNSQTQINNANLSSQIIDSNMSSQMNIQKLPDIYLQNPSYTTEHMQTYTIKAGTILYHATSNKKGFDTNYLNLGEDKIINFFTPNFRLASDKIEGCSIDKQNGFIHVFKVKNDIPNIYVKLPYDIANDINSGSLVNEFCSKNQNYYGIGFFYPKNNIEMFSNDQSQYNKQLNLANEEVYYSEFGLCNPKPYLEYQYTQKCQSLRKLSDPYRFN